MTRQRLTHGPWVIIPLSIAFWLVIDVLAAVTRAALKLTMGGA